MKFGSYMLLLYGIVALYYGIVCYAICVCMFVCVCVCVFVCLLCMLCMYECVTVGIFNFSGKNSAGKVKYKTTLYYLNRTILFFLELTKE